jgi:hypothetical protein
VGFLEGSSDGTEELVGIVEKTVLGTKLGIDDLVGEEVDGVSVDGD